jgi:hypothetical protein
MQMFDCLSRSRDTHFVNGMGSCLEIKNVTDQIGDSG